MVCVVAAYGATRFTVAGKSCAIVLNIDETAPADGSKTVLLAERIAQSAVKEEIAGGVKNAPRALRSAEGVARAGSHASVLPCITAIPAQLALVRVYRLEPAYVVISTAFALHHHHPFD